MDWTQTLTILGVFVAGFVYMMSRMDSHKRDTDQKIDHLGEQLSNRIDKMEKESNTRFSGIENRLTAMEAESKNTSQRLTDLKTDINQRLSNIEGYLVPKKIYRFVDEPEDHPKEQ